MSAINIVLHDEVQVLDFGESRSIGPWIKLRLKDPELLAVFRGMDVGGAKKTGHILNCTLAEGDIATLADALPESKPAEAVTRYPAESQALKVSDFFRRPDVWRAIGSDAEFLAWVKTRACKAGSKNNTGCHGAVVAAHVRRIADGAGTGIKPEYAAIPLCHAHHALQHAQGESAIAPKEQWDKWRIETVSQWCWDTLKEKLGHESWATVPPERLRGWVVINHIDLKWLPEAYR